VAAAGVPAGALVCGKRPRPGLPERRSAGAGPGLQWRPPTIFRRRASPALQREAKCSAPAILRVCCGPAGAMPFRPRPLDRREGRDGRGRSSGRKAPAMTHNGSTLPFLDSDDPDAEQLAEFGTRRSSFFVVRRAAYCPCGKDETGFRSTIGSSNLNEFPLMLHPN